MKQRYKKSPSGKFIAIRPDKLHLSLLAGTNSLHDLGSFDFNMEANEGNDNHSNGYTTENFDIRKLYGMEVTDFGTGSVGSHIAWSLGHAQLLLNLVDSKKVEYKHTTAGRTIFDQTQIGMLKVEAVKEKLEANFIGTKVNPLPYDVAEIPDTELIRMFQRSAIVILVIDDPAQILRINHLAYRLVEIIQVGINRQGKSGFIAVSIPYTTPCLACTLGITDQRSINRLNGEPAAGLDISIVSQQAARIAMDLMYSKVTGNNPTIWNVNKNLIYITNTQNKTNPDGPGILYEDSQKRHGCPVCSR